MRKADQWLRRSMGMVDGMPVGAPGELWRVVPKHPANDWVRDKAKQFGRSFTDSDVAYYTSRSHLYDVLYAAAAIEYTVARIDAVCNAVQAYVEKHSIAAGDDGVPVGVASSDVDEAYWEYANLLTWIRTLIDRMSSKDPHSKAKLGLIPALSEQGSLRPAVATAFNRFKGDPLIEDEVHLTNYGLHLHSLPGGGTPLAQVVSSGQVRMLIPDKPRERIYLFDQFAYDDERELGSFAHAVLDRVGSFIDELLTAFETGTREAMMSRPQGNN